MHYYSAHTVARCWRRLRFTIATAVLGTMLGGCAAIDAMPRPITAADVKNRICPTDQEVADFSGMPAGSGRGAYRNIVLGKCIDAYNARYREFKVELHRLSGGSNLAIDIVSGTLTSLASIASPKTAKRLATGANIALGAGSAINKDLFFQATLPAILASMDANRAKVLKRIAQSKAGDPEGKIYSLADGANDLGELESASDLYLAITELNKTAALAADKASDDASEARFGPLGYDTTVIEKTVHAREVLISAYIFKVAAGDRKTKLDPIATALKVPIDDKEPLDHFKARLMTTIDDRISAATDQKNEMNTIDALLTPLMK